MWFYDLSICSPWRMLSVGDIHMEIYRSTLKGFCRIFRIHNVDVNLSIRQCMRDIDTLKRFPLRLFFSTCIDLLSSQDDIERMTGDERKESVPSLGLFTRGNDVGCNQMFFQLSKRKRDMKTLQPFSLARMKFRHFVDIA